MPKLKDLQLDFRSSNCHTLEMSTLSRINEPHAVIATDSIVQCRGQAVLEHQQGADIQDVSDVGQLSRSLVKYLLFASDHIQEDTFVIGLVGASDLL